MIAICILLALVCFGIYAICNYNLYKELENNGVATSSSTAGPGPDILFRYLIYKRKNSDPVGVVCYLGILMFISACALIIYAVVAAI